MNRRDFIAGALVSTPATQSMPSIAQHFAPKPQAKRYYGYQAYLPSVKEVYDLLAERKAERKS